MELGGNSPFIVFDDAKMDTAVEACILAKFRNSGQTCVTANRIFVQEGIYDEFAKALTERVKTLQVGNGVKEGVFVGPLTHECAVEKALHHIEDAKSHGASVALWGVFAPVVALYRFETEEEVISRVNDCEVGLGSFIVTESMARMWRVAENLEVGMVGVNQGLLSACESPFGGVKESGYGREGGRQGIEEYLTVKSILINIAT
ncbi:uncharacterized protein RCC_02704 [Ramularia collo-cygni]|uniref:Aldehyde dehydrogenase domain-containing protein n=1 Tax=Ramularia collo-cygni TaxID=112498 RepID=A0A2D3V5V9_9PEZI|nr:uncharacterized protein RCC_02704 [Ramularia collo-cygni]CZT16869.1 uncharacterized protein RCC_02704 [Ramularia collo-cygni]